MRDAMERHTPMQRLGEVEDIALMALYLHFGDFRNYLVARLGDEIQAAEQTEAPQPEPGEARCEGGYDMIVIGSAANYLFPDTGATNATSVSRLTRCIQNARFLIAIDT